MKRISLLLALATSLGLPLAHSQDNRLPETPRPPAASPLPPPPPTEAPRPGPPARDERPPGEERHGDRPRTRDIRRHDFRERGEEGLPPRPTRPTPYLGVSTAPVPPVLAAQLGLPEGFGIVVEEVLPDSPAARAGLQRFDVLKQINDQQLVGPEQLATLVRSYGKDADVTLTVLRKGAEQKLPVKIGERMLPERRPFHFDTLRQNVLPKLEHAEREMGEKWGKWKEEFGDRMKDYNERMKDYGERMRDFKERMEKFHRAPAEGSPQAAPPKPPEPPKAPELPPPPTVSLDPERIDILREVRPGGAPGIVVHRDGGVTAWNTAKAHVVLKDSDGVVELRNENGKRTITARGPDGIVIQQAPVDTEEQRAALPEPVRVKLERIDEQSHLRSPGAKPEVLALETAPAVGIEREIQ